MKKILLIIAVCLLTITGCQKKTGLIGSWVHDNYVYTFNKDNTGSYTAYSNVLEFTYEDKGDKVTIRYKGNTSSVDFPYKIEKNKLTIKDSFGNDIIYKRK